MNKIGVNTAWRKSLRGLTVSDKMATKKCHKVDYRELWLTYLVFVLLGGISCTEAKEKTVYTLHTTPVSWNTAKSVCWRNGEKLAVVDNAIVSSVLQDFIDTDWININVSTSYWIGLFREADRTQPSTWSGYCQNGTNYQNWEAGESSLDNSGHCTSVNFTTGKWLSKSCSEKLNFVCESIQGPCTFREYSGVYLLDSSQFKAELRSYSSFYTECTETFCNSDSIRTNGKECWGVVHNQTKGACVTYLSRSKEAVANSVQRVSKVNTDLYLRVCDAGNCAFEKYPNTSLKDSYDYETKTLPWNALGAECKEYCGHAVKDGMQCWAVVVSSSCVAFFSSHPMGLMDSSHRRAQESTTLYLRTCDEAAGTCHFTEYSNNMLQIPANITYVTQNIALQLTSKDCLDYCTSMRNNAPQCWAAVLMNINGQCTQYFSSAPGKLLDRRLWVEQSDTNLHLRMCYEGRLNMEIIPDSMTESSSQPQHPCYYSNDTTEELTARPHTDTEVTEPSIVMLSHPPVTFTNAEAMEPSTILVSNPSLSFTDTEFMGPSTIVVSNSPVSFAETELMEHSTTLVSNHPLNFTTTELIETSAVMTSNPQLSFTDSGYMEPSAIFTSNSPLSFTDSRFMEPSVILASNPQLSFTESGFVEPSAILASNPPLAFTDTDTHGMVLSTVLVPNLALTVTDSEVMESSTVMFSDYAQDGITPTATKETPVETSGSKDQLWPYMGLKETSELVVLQSESLTSCHCPCSTRKFLSSEKSSAFMSSILDDLSVPKEKISSYGRKRKSVMENRPVATGLGCLGAVILGVVFGGLILLDLPHLLGDISRLVHQLLHRD